MRLIFIMLSVFFSELCNNEGKVQDGHLPCIPVVLNDNPRVKPYLLDSLMGNSFKLRDKSEYLKDAIGDLDLKEFRNVIRKMDSLLNIEKKLNAKYVYDKGVILGVSLCGTRRAFIALPNKVILLDFGHEYDSAIAPVSIPTLNQVNFRSLYYTIEHGCDVILVICCENSDANIIRLQNFSSEEINRRSFFLDMSMPETIEEHTMMQLVGSLRTPLKYLVNE